MAVATEVVALKKLAPVAGRFIDVAIPVFAVDEIFVTYGRDEIPLIIDVDYSITLLDEDNFNTFVLTPLASLITKIATLRAVDATEENAIVVRRTLNYLTESSPAYSQRTDYVSLQHDKTIARFQQQDERLDRAWHSRFGLPGRFIEVIPEGNFWKSGKNGNAVDGGSAADIETAEAFAAQVTAIANEFGNVAGIVAAAEDAADRAEVAAENAEATTDAIVEPLLLIATNIVNMQNLYITLLAS